MENSSLKMVFSTASSYDNAMMILRNIIYEKLAFCCNILPNSTSIYVWDGKVVEETEYMLIIKTDSSKLEALKKRIQELHDYQIPEIVVIDISDTTFAYSNWAKSILNSIE